MEDFNRRNILAQAQCAFILVLTGKKPNSAAICQKCQMTLNLNKTWEMLLKSGSLKVPPDPLAIVERKPKLKLLGVTFENDPVNWDSHIDHVLCKASSRF